MFILRKGRSSGKVLGWLIAIMVVIVAWGALSVIHGGNEYVGMWMGGIQQGGATMPFKFQFNADMTCTIWPADLPVVNTTYEFVENGKFLALFNNRTEAIQGTVSQGETGKFLDFCYHGDISLDQSGKMRSKTQMCGTAQKR